MAHKKVNPLSQACSPVKTPMINIVDIMGKFTMTDGTYVVASAKGVGFDAAYLSATGKYRVTLDRIPRDILNVQVTCHNTDGALRVAVIAAVTVATGIIDIWVYDGQATNTLVALTSKDTINFRAAVTHSKLVPTNTPS